MARLRSGAADVAAFKQGVEQIAGGAPLQFVTTDADTAKVQRSIHLQAVALRLFAALTAIAAVLVVGQAFAQQTTAETADYPTLGALGMTRRQLWGVAMAQAATISGVGALVAIGLGYALSPLAPIGIARDAEPAPGLSFDATTLLLGGAAIIVLAVALIAVQAWARSGPPPLDDAPTDRPPRLVESLAGMGPRPRSHGPTHGVGARTPAGIGAGTDAAIVTTVFCISAVLVVAT